MGGLEDVEGIRSEEMQLIQVEDPSLKMLKQACRLHAALHHTIQMLMSCHTQLSRCRQLSLKTSWD